MRKPQSALDPSSQCHSSTFEHVGTKQDGTHQGCMGQQLQQWQRTGKEKRKCDALMAHQRSTVWEEDTTVVVRTSWCVTGTSAVAV
jgi:hypothetical protein